jgi:diguanylate cyclase (GGDEF)-like protein
MPIKQFSQKIASRKNAILWTEICTVMLASVAISSLTIGVRQAKVLQSLELNAYDQMLRLQSQTTPDPRLLIVAINEADINKHQEWPVSDATITQLLKQLQKAQPKVIGLDVHRDIPQPPGRDKLLQQLQANNVVIVEKGNRLDADNYISPPPEINFPDERVGFTDFVVDPDNIIRRNLLAFTPDGENILYSFALRVSLKYLQQSPQPVIENLHQPVKINSTQFIELGSNAGSYQMSSSDMAGWQTMLKYHSEENLATQVSLSDVLQGRVAPSQIKDKIVLIGITAPSSKDLFATPYSISTAYRQQQAEANETQANNQGENFLMPGVIIHAQMVHQILSTVLDHQQQIWFLPEWGEWLWIFAWSVLGGIIILRTNHPLLLIGLGGATVGGLWGMSYFLFTQSGWMPVIPATISLIGAGVGTLGYKFFWHLYHDSLTHLPNRRFFVTQLEQFNRDKKKRQCLIAVFFLDLDRFKMVNEALGNEAGDELLATAGLRLQRQLLERGRIARVGGDEFAIWLKSVDNKEAALNIAEKVCDTLSLPFSWHGQDIYTSVSIGIAFNRTGKEFRAEDLVRDAQTAMYRGKTSGKIEIHIHGEEEETKEKLQLESEIRKALAQEELELYFQPIVSFKTGKISGFESLVRWHSPSRGLVSPSVFIPIAEETGLIIPIGQWILQKACQQMQEWHQIFPYDPPLIMSVNLSSRQFTQPDLVQQIQRVLEDLNIEGNSLKLEITESMMMNNMDAAIELLKNLKDLGLRLSIDDFGTGYSSLSYLHRFPVDTLKIDQSFVRRMADGDDHDRYAQIVRTVIMLGHNLELDVIAEGVETPEQMAILKSLNCEYGQGYLFSKPMPGEKITELLAGNPQW